MKELEAEERKESSCRNPVNIPRRNPQLHRSKEDTQDFPNATWDLFKEELLLRFGDTTYVNHEIELRNLKQTSTVQDYQTKFERLSSMVKNRPVESKIAHFIGGLNEDIQIEMLRDPPTELRRCFALAKEGGGEITLEAINPNVDPKPALRALIANQPAFWEVNFQPLPTASTAGCGEILSEDKSSTPKAEIFEAPSRACEGISREVKDPLHTEDLGGLGLGDLDPPGLGGEDPNLPCSDDEGLGALSLGVEDPRYTKVFTIGWRSLSVGLEGRTPDSVTGKTSNVPSSPVHSLRPRKGVEAGETRGREEEDGAFSCPKNVRLAGSSRFQTLTGDDLLSIREQSSLNQGKITRQRRRRRSSAWRDEEKNRRIQHSLEGGLTPGVSLFSPRLERSDVGAQVKSTAQIRCRRRSGATFGISEEKRLRTFSAAAVLSQFTTEPPLAAAISLDSGGVFRQALYCWICNQILYNILNFEACAHHLATFLELVLQRELEEDTWKQLEQAVGPGGGPFGGA
ncbi:hypothetical protein EJ110_NYTH11555 [Nymphaea thermarum]|nr:hypothetical protein EJ110_NYTH11555 [Nymphaea thermarum]